MQAHTCLWNSSVKNIGLNYSKTSELQLGLPPQLSLIPPPQGFKFTFQRGGGMPRETSRQ